MIGTKSRIGSAQTEKEGRTMADIEKVIKGLQAHADGYGYRSRHCNDMDCPYRYGDESCDIEEMCRDALELLKEQKEEISNYKEIAENLLQQLQDISKYMTPIGQVSDVRAYLDGRPQPEIIRCYACKYGEHANDVYLCGKQRGFGIAHKPNWFCADGELAEQNVTK